MVVTRVDPPFFDEAGLESSIARVDPGLPGSVGQALGWSDDGTPILLDDTFNAHALGFRVANTAAVNKAILDAIIDAMSDGQTLYVPRGHYLCNNLAPIDKTIALRGDGSMYFHAQSPYGHADYADPDYLFGGTIIKATSTSGIFFDLTNAREGVALHLFDIGFLGVGDATRTNTCVALGNTGLSNWSSKAMWSNVWFVNFYIADRSRNRFQSLRQQVTYHGCRQAYVWSDACNENYASQITIASCGDAGVAICEYNNCGVNSTVGITSQTNEGGTVFWLHGASEENTFTSIYGEDSATDYLFDVEAGSDRNEIQQVHAYGTGGGDNIRIGSANNRIQIAKYLNADLTETGSLNTWYIVQPPAEVPLTLGPGSVRIGPTDDYPNRYAIEAQNGTVFKGIIEPHDGVRVNNKSAGTQWSNQWLFYQAGGNDLYIRDLANSRMWGQIKGGTTKDNSVFDLAAILYLQAALEHAGTTVGFNGATPVGKRTLGAAATDPASTQNLANNLRQALIDLGLGQT